MNSLEALKHLINDCNLIFWYDNTSKAIEIIKQDLERLKVLEEENKQLKAKLDRSLPKVVIRNTLDNVLPSLEEENEKLKQAIEILKLVCSVNCDKTLETERQFFRLTKEEYELLKEVLGNE